MNTNKTVTVEFDATPVSEYTLNASVIGGHGSINPTGGTYNAGTSVTLTATPDAGYQVKAWTGTDNDASTTNTNTVSIDADRTVTLEFEPIPVIWYTLRASVVSGHGSVSPTGGIHGAGTTVTLTATPDVGYQVKAWIGTDNDASTTSTNAVTMNADTTATVEFEPSSVTGDCGTTACDGEQELPGVAATQASASSWWAVLCGAGGVGSASFVMMGLGLMKRSAFRTRRRA